MSAGEHDVDSLVKVGSLIEQKIGHEVALLGSRMAWFSIFQSFLYGIYSWAAFNHDATAVDERVAILFMAPVIGQVVSFVVWRSAHAAEMVIDHLSLARYETEKLLRESRTLPASLRDRIPLLGSDARTRPEIPQSIPEGRLANRAMPLVNLSAWLMLLLVSAVRVLGILHVHVPWILVVTVVVAVDALGFWLYRRDVARRS